MYRYMILFLFIIVSVPVFASRTFTSQMPYYNANYGAYYGGDHIPKRMYMPRKNFTRFSDINELERYALNRNFSKDSDVTRLERLETLAFGAVQRGDINARYDNVREAILTRPKQNYKTSLLRNISDFFSGKLTGYTPNINQDVFDTDFDDSSFGKSSAVNYSSPWGNGYRTNRYGTGSGFGVHIVD